MAAAGRAEGATGRSAVYARDGLVATAHPLATAAGLEVLAAGGNAADAAVAMMGALYVVLPMLCGVGGDAFILHYGARDRRVTAFCGSGAAAAAATPEAYAALGHTERMPSQGMLAVAVPGAIDATWELLRRFGSGRMAMPRLWRRAVGYAEGHALPPKAAHAFASAPAAFRPGGRSPAAGEVVRQPALARTLASIAEHGPDWFYRGPFAEALEAYCRAQGGLLLAADLAAHRTWVGEPLALPLALDGLRFFVPPPPSQGMILLEELGLLAGDTGLDPLSAEGAHLLIEAKKRAFADRLAFAGDPAVTRMPLRGLLTPAYLRARRGSIDPARAATSEVPPGDPWAYEGDGGGAPSPARPDGAGGQDTTSFVVVDREGNAASVIISLFFGWGSGEVVEGTGVLLNNRAHGFSLRAGHPNRLAPRKRTMHTLHCYLATDEAGDLALLGGTPGGDSQPQWNLQVLMHLLRGGADPQRAVERPRWSSHPGTTPEPEPGAAYGLTFEDGFPDGVSERLAEMGHALHRVGRFSGGGAAQLIRRVGPVRGPGATVFAAGSDPRADGGAGGM